MGVISRNESLIHTQRDEAREGEDNDLELKSNPQLNTFNTPARFVGDVKVTVILLPSDVNSDRRIDGGGKISADGGDAEEYTEGWPVG